jgi:hypothetical protein
MNLHDAQKFFHFTFSLNFNAYACLLTTTPDRAKLDVVKFDEWLHQQFGEYEDLDKSMKDVLEEAYGHDVMKRVEALL